MDDKQYIIYSHMFVNVDKEYIYIQKHILIYRVMTMNMKN
jgi:hypothetical protein